jgi:hypothetical protein
VRGKVWDGKSTLHRGAEEVRPDVRLVRRSGAVYTGLEFGVNDQGAFLYAANVTTGRVDVFDSTFKPAGDKLTGHFSDPKIPSGFVPFGIHAIDGNLAVTYARQNAYA